MRQKLFILTLLLLITQVFNGCESPKVLNPTFSQQNELLVFTAEGEFVRRSPRLGGMPEDIELLNNGRAVVAINAIGLLTFEANTGRLSAPFGPKYVNDVDVVAGKTINNFNPVYMTVSQHETQANLLNKSGNILTTVKVPAGTVDIDLLDNGNFLIANKTNNKIAELNSNGDIVWSSTIPLNNPCEVVPTKSDTFLIVDFDFHRIVEIDRNNKVHQTIKGFNHPRKMQLLSDGIILVADGDHRSIVACIDKDNRIPIVKDLNRPSSLAFDEIDRLMIVGIEPFFRPSVDDYIQNTHISQLHNQSFYLFSILFFVCLVGLYIVRIQSIQNWSYKLGQTFKNHFHYWNWGYWFLAMLFCITACICFSNSLIRFGFVMMFVGLLVAFVIYLCNQTDFQWDRCCSFMGNQDKHLAFIQRRTIFMIGILICWSAYILSLLYSLQWWILVPWIIGPVFCIFGFTQRYKNAIQWIDCMWLLAVIAIAAFFRLYKIDEIPFGLWLDEVLSVHNALRQYSSEFLPPFQGTPLIRVGEFEVPNLYSIGMILSAQIFGMSFYLIKLYSIIPSIGIVIASFYLGKWAFSNWVGRFSSLLLAINAWQITFARWGWLQQWYVFFAILALAFFIRALRWKCPRSAAIGGICIGLGFYTYVPIVITTATIILLFVISFIETERWMNVKLSVVFILLIFFVASPIMNYYSSTSGGILARSNKVGIQNEILNNRSVQPVFTSLNKYALMLHYKGDFNPRHNVPNQPLLDPVTGGLFLIGLILLCLRFYGQSERLILLASITALLGGILSSSREAPNSFRTGTFGPFVCIIASFPLALFIKQTVEKNRMKIFSIVAVGLMIISITGFTTTKYFMQFPKENWGATFGAESHLIYENLTVDEIGHKRLFIHPKYANTTTRLYLYLLEVGEEGFYNCEYQKPRFALADYETRIPKLTEENTTVIMPVEYKQRLLKRYPNIELEEIQNIQGKPHILIGRITQ
jgi:4-amino-4-deoxy-L-arabinose transferase-like glycosyltransferase